MTELPLLKRSRHWQEIKQAASEGYLSLQVCQQCGHVQYPPRDVCGQCLSDDLNWQRIGADGVVNSWTQLHTSTHGFFREYVPWHVANIELENGVVLYAFASSNCLKTGAKVRVHTVINNNEDVFFVATSVDGKPETEFEKLTELIQGENNE